MGNDARPIGIKLSIIDRIIGSSPATQAPKATGRYRPGFSELEDSVRRDLWSLLNTRRPDEVVAEEFPEAASSLLTFGIPDFTSSNALSSEDQERIRRAIETAIQRFESRLSNVTVSLDRRKSNDEQTMPHVTSLRYRVRALLKVEPAPEPVAFDAVVEPASGQVFLLS